MNFHVFDTYVKAKDGHTMHFDAITNTGDLEKAISFAKEWLKSISEEASTVTANECKFCHTHKYTRAHNQFLKTWRLKL